MSVQKCSDFLNEEKHSDIEATHLIGQDGVVKAGRGVIKVAEGCFDLKGQRYPGAIGKDGKIYTSLPDINALVVYVNKGKMPARNVNQTTVAVAGGGMLNV